MSVSGYSKTPIWKKLGIKTGFSCYAQKAPKHYFDLIIGCPQDADWDQSLTDKQYDFIHLFSNDEEELTGQIPLLKDQLKKTGMLWISWPKKTSKLATNLDGNVVRETGLRAGLVDIKVCALDEDWSGLKFVFRKSDR